MRLATTTKIDEPMSPRFGRRRAGRKGVGRFAAERLGHKLILTTAKINSNEASRLEINWDAFIAGTDLSAISVPILRVPKPFPEGTVIRVEVLRDSWTQSAIERTFRSIANLIDPGNQTASLGSDSDFFVRFFIDGRGYAVVDTRTEILSYALATVEGNIDGVGAITYGMRCARLGINFTGRQLRVGESDSNILGHARNVKIVAHYFILDRSNIAATAFTTVQSYLSGQGGINVFRNGFRVAPYGQAGDDWLGLDQLSSRRTGTLAPIRNRNFLGSVSIGDEGSLFEETSSREGLIQSEAFSELTMAMQSILLTAVREIDAERTRRSLKREQAPSNKSNQLNISEGSALNQISGADAADDLRQVLAKVKRALGTVAIPGGNKPDSVMPALDQLDIIAEVVGRKAVERDELLKEIDLLRVLASMGLAVGQFTHEFSTLNGAMRADLTVLTEPGRPDGERVSAANSLRTLLGQARAFSGLFRSMTEGNALRERQRIDMYAATTAFATALRSILDRNSITFRVADEGEVVLTPPMHQSELFAVLLNLTTNSIKAIKRAKRKGEIYVQLRRGTASSILEFNDNGDGVSAEVRDTIFDAFVTTTAVIGDVTSDDELALGSGLGLTIVRDIVNAVSGYVGLVEAVKPFETCFRVELPFLSGE